MQLKRLSVEKSNDIRNRTCDFLACDIVPLNEYHEHMVFATLVTGWELVLSS
jgi:hypothetical protein